MIKINSMMINVAMYLIAIVPKDENPLKTQSGIIVFLDIRKVDKNIF